MGTRARWLGIPVPKGPSNSLLLLLDSSWVASVVDKVWGSRVLTSVLKLQLQRPSVFLHRHTCIYIYIHMNPQVELKDGGATAIVIRPPVLKFRNLLPHQ